MKALTNQDYYNILIEATKEAFESIELKEFLYSDEAMEDNKEIFVSQNSIEQLGIKKSNDLIVNYQIEKNIVVVFLRFLDRQQLIFNKSHLIDRNYFFKRCLAVINVKLTELNKKEKYRILRGISDMGTPPDTLLFLEYVKFHIKNRALQSYEVQEIKAVEKTKPKQGKPIKEEKKSLELKDFFNKDFDENKIQMIKESFKDLKVGKKMAHLIYILHTERKLIVYYANDKTKARTHFIKALTESDKRTSGADYYFEKNNTTLKDPHFKKDGDYSTIKNQLEAIIDVQ
jgi:hypothetical protein